MIKHVDNQQRYDSEMIRLKQEVDELEQRKGKKKEILEEMDHKLRVELERVGKELKQSQREVDRLEYEGEENEKDMKSSKKQIKKEIEERERMVDESGELRKLVEDYANLKREKREKMKQLQQNQVKATSRIKDQMEQKAKLEKAREQNVGEIKRLDTRIDRLNLEL